MLIKEFRMALPLTVEEYNIAQLYMVAKQSEEETGGGEGVEVLENEPFDNERGQGQYTYKILHIASRLPKWVAAVLPTSAMQFHEKAWNMYPHCTTEYHCPYFKDTTFSITVESRYVADRGNEENIFNLSPEELKLREVDRIDLSAEQPAAKDYVKEHDPAVFKSTKTGRGPFSGDWIQTSEPMMTAYKLIKVNVDVSLVGKKAEAFTYKSALRDTIIGAHRKLICWMDEWHGMTIEDIRKMEAESAERLARQIKEGEAKKA